MRPEGEVFAAYEARGFAPIWLGENGPSAAATAYLEALGQADRHALPVERYGREELRARLADLRDLDLAARAALEADLTASFLAYARDLNSGALVPRKVDRELHVYPERPEPHTLITGLGDATDPARWLAELAPQDPVYARLVARYETYRMLADGAAWGESLPKRRTLREGERSDLVPLLRDRLTAMGYLEDDRQVQGTLLIASNETANDAENGLVEEAVDPNRYDPALVAAVTQFQARHGLNQDGVVGPATRAALNVEPGFRAAQIAVNLERMRWLNRDLGAKHILVNLAAFEFDVLEDGKSVFNSRTVVGKARKHRTPEFSDEMDHMVINPTWFVPRSIAREEILPALQEDPTYLSRKNMRITGVDDPSTIDWSTITPDTFPGKVRQAPGSGNALGR
ncbi:MAG: peptidoglycan-binding protein, partial [Pseudomonadota bacterium]